MNKYEEAVRQLQKGIETYVDKKISETKFDKTYIGIITAITDNNTYSVNVKNVIYNNVPVAGNAVCKLNEIVKVLVPMNNFNNMFIINVNNDYVNNINKPKINGVEIIGDLTSADLHIGDSSSISEFGGWVQTIGEFFSNKKGSKNVGMSPNKNRYALWAGETNGTNGLIDGCNAYFKLKQNGELSLHSDKVVEQQSIKKGSLFIDFTPEDKDDIFSAYYRKDMRLELISLPNSTAKRIYKDDVYVTIIDENGNEKTVFDPTAYFADMGNGYISRVYSQTYKDYEENPYVNPLDRENIKFDENNISGTKNNTVSAGYGAFTTYNTYNPDLVNSNLFLSNSSNLTVSFGLGTGADTAQDNSLTFYNCSSINDDEQTITFVCNRWSPVYWGYGIGLDWDSRETLKSGVTLKNNNLSKNKYNCFILSNGEILPVPDDKDDEKKTGHILYYVFRMDAAPCFIPDYDKTKYQTVLDLPNSLKGTIICLGNGTGTIPELENNPKDIEELQNLLNVKKIMYISRDEDLVLNSPKLKNKLSIINNSNENVDILNIKDKYNINIGRLNPLTKNLDYKNAIHFEEGFDSDKNWQRKIIIETDKLILRTKNGDIELGVATTNTSTSNTTEENTI